MSGWRPGGPPRGLWVGFGFGGFGQIVSGEAPEACAPSPAWLRPRGAGGHPPELRRLSPAWSSTGGLTVDGQLVLSGFLGGCPQQYVQLPSHGCLDILAAEKYLLLMFNNCVECYDTDALRSGRSLEDPVWKMDLPAETGKDGHVMPKPPFFRTLPCDIKAQKLSLGTEHALLLSSTWEVFTWGSGRHGQLGHGGLEDVSEPLVVEGLRGISMSDVAAGSWHSVSISESGDIYTWGWNESGQLGLPSKRLAEESKGASSCTSKEAGQGNGNLGEKPAKETKNSPTPDKGNLGEKPAKETTNPSTLEEDNLVEKPAKKTTNPSTPEEGNLGEKPKKETNNPSTPEDCNLGGSSEGIDTLEKDGDPVSDFISIQAFPALLDLPEESEVLRVSCGSRHTSAVTRDGCLYTWGWGAYGQLGHSDANSLDQPRLVEYFLEKQLFVKDVVCGLWNTFVLCIPKANSLDRQLDFGTRDIPTSLS
ncbi:RCC1 domain-containing protein 1 isoform X2 [Ambystoma mexicanum]|uniref:RCC1 domain-containing protein 1 isoform X2 n=1 Tax=Ambystoma mexicanum TaxID=8296 RepID=UPI0037E76F66